MSTTTHITVNITPSASYVGEHANGKAHGIGTTILTNGDSYVGSSRTGQKDGSGCQMLSTGIRYVGEWQRDQRHGTGAIFWPNGHRYLGEWFLDQQHGFGIMTLCDGASYEGIWRQNKRHGYGHYKEQGFQYSGEWESDQFHGFGTLTYQGSRYEGAWARGLRHGRGVFKDETGGEYNGEWSHNERHGSGRLTLPQQSATQTYEGPWTHNVPIGSIPEKTFTFTRPIPNMPEPAQKRFHALIVQANYDHNKSLTTEQPKQLSKALAIGGYQTTVIHFQTPDHLKDQIEQIAESLAAKVNLLWIRAHGSDDGSKIVYGPDQFAGFDTLSPLLPLLAMDPHIIISSCNAGRKRGLAARIRNAFFESRKSITILAPKGSLSHEGLDLEALAERNEIQIFMLSTFGKNVLRSFKSEP